MAIAPPSALSEDSKTSVLVRLVLFGRDFVRSVGPRWLATAILLVLLGGATEGIGLVVLVPLIELLGDAEGATGRIGLTIRQALAAFGLPVLLPMLLLVFVALIILRTMILALRDVAFGRLQLDFIDTVLSRHRRRKLVLPDAPETF
jgi:hypothetical protein